jgi:hypothetical protein
MPYFPDVVVIASGIFFGIVPDLLQFFDFNGSPMFECYIEMICEYCFLKS